MSRPRVPFIRVYNVERAKNTLPMKHFRALQFSDRSSVNVFSSHDGRPHIQQHDVVQCQNPLLFKKGTSRCLNQIPIFTLNRYGGKCFHVLNQSEEMQLQGRYYLRSKLAKSGRFCRLFKHGLRVRGSGEG